MVYSIYIVLFLVVVVWLDGLDPSRSRSTVGTIESLGNIRGWIYLGSGHPFAKGNSRSRGTGKVQMSTQQTAGRPVLSVSFFPSG